MRFRPESERRKRKAFWFLSVFVGVGIFWYAATAIAVASETASGVADEAGSWVQSSAGVGFGFLDFEVRRERPEWNLGLARAWTSRARFPSFLGGGLAVTRSLWGDDVAERAVREELDLRGWVGGCLTCALVGTARFTFEARWMPESGWLLEGSREPEERRAGIRFEFDW